MECLLSHPSSASLHSWKRLSLHNNLVSTPFHVSHQPRSVFETPRQRTKTTVFLCVCVFFPLTFLQNPKCFLYAVIFPEVIFQMNAVQFRKASALFTTSLKCAVFLIGIAAPSSMPVIISNHLTWPRTRRVLGLKVPWVMHLKSLITPALISYSSNLSSRLELGMKSKARNDGSVFWGRIMTLPSGTLRLAFGRTRET